MQSFTNSRPVYKIRYRFGERPQPGVFSSRFRFFHSSGSPEGSLYEEKKVMHMTNNQDYIQNLLSSVWPEWRITGLLGKGSYSSVYEIIRDDLGSGYKSIFRK